MKAGLRVLELTAIAGLGVLSSAGTCGGGGSTPAPVVVLDCASDAECNTSGKINGVCDPTSKRCTYPAVTIRLDASFPDGRTMTLPRNGAGGIILPVGMRGAAYDLRLQAVGGNGIYSWKRNCTNCGTDLAPGVRLESSGAIRGTPYSAAPEACQWITVNSGDKYDTQTVCLTVLDRQPNTLQPIGPINGTGQVVLSNAIIGAPYRNLETGQATIIKITGGLRPPYVIEQTAGALPTGLTFEVFNDPQGGYAKITGAATAAGTYVFNMRASDTIYQLHRIVDVGAGTFLERSFTITVTDCGNSAAVQGACAAGLANECTCAATDPCNWDHDGKCQQGCWRYHDRFDDSLDCPDCTNTTFVTQSCSSRVRNECTCAGNDPCNWKSDGTCDKACGAFYGPFDDSLDCMDCSNFSLVQQACNSGLANSCTCGYADPCDWQANGICNQQCATFPSHFNDALDCEDCSNQGAVQTACYQGLHNKCTCAVNDPCGWSEDGICETGCQVYATRFDDSVDCMSCSDYWAVQDACTDGVRNKCTCAWGDPCDWSDDNICDSACNAFADHFTEPDDCLNCSGTEVTDACTAGTHNACTCGLADPCGWANDGFCDSQCNTFTSHFDDGYDCQDCSVTATVQSYCSSYVKNACTCAAADPCNWENDGYCDHIGCQVFANHFEDTEDCLDCSNTTQLNAACTAGTHNRCTCAANDPCDWQNDTFCDSACQAYTNTFDDSSDCLSCTTTQTQQACSAFTVNKCTCAATDPCGWQNDGYCDSACAAYSDHFEDTDDCLDCSNTTEVQADCSSTTRTRCTCGTADPCGWQEDGYCDSQCEAFANHFDDSWDCSF